MLLDQQDTKAARWQRLWQPKLVEKIKMLESKLVALKGSNIYASTSLQLEIACQEIVDLKTRLDAIQLKYESVEKEIGCHIPQIKDIERAVFKLHSVAYAKDKELIVAYNQVIHFKKVVDKLEPLMLELQGTLKINESLKKEVDELQRVCVSLLEEIRQLKCEKAGLEAPLVQSQADFYKLVM
ncbi:hypothetical protein ACFX2F_015086 [Malus domestica]